jgi:hypothetical protein
MKYYIFKVTYANEKMIMLNDFMSKLDLGSQKFYLQEDYEMGYSDEGKRTPQELALLIKETMESLGHEVVEVQYSEKMRFDV